MKKREIVIDRYRNKNNSYKLRSKKINIYLFDKEITLEKNGNENENSTLKSDIIINVNNGDMTFDINKNNTFSHSFNLNLLLQQIKQLQ